MSSVLLSLSNRQNRRRWRSLAITLLLLYLLLFSIFALFHAYAANELDGAHGCNIGQWIHLSFHAAVLFLMVVGTLLLFDIGGSAPLPFVKTLLWSDRFERGPPSFPALIS
jgi:cytochrome c biogenesis factor